MGVGVVRRVHVPRVLQQAPSHHLCPRLNTFLAQSMPRRKPNHVVKPVTTDFSKSDNSELGELHEAHPESQSSEQQLLDYETWALQMDLTSLLDAARQTDETQMVVCTKPSDVHTCFATSSANRACIRSGCEFIADKLVADLITEIAHLLVICILGSLWITWIFQWNMSIVK